MKKIEVTIRAERLSAVTGALAQVELVGMNVLNIAGWRAQRIMMSVSRGTGKRWTRVQSQDRAKVRLEVVVSDMHFQAALDTIAASAQPASPGDEMIFITPMSDVIPILERPHDEPILGHSIEPNGDHQVESSVDLVLEDASSS